MSTHYEGNAVEQQALDLYIKLTRATNSVNACLNEEITRLGFTTGQFGVLEAIYHLGPLCLSELSRKILTSEANMTMIVDNLERDGFAERERSSEDRRYILVHLTERGRETMDEIFADHVRSIVTVFSSLSANEQRQLGALCRKLGLSLHVPVPSGCGSG